MRELPPSPKNVHNNDVRVIRPKTQWETEARPHSLPLKHDQDARQQPFRRLHTLFALLRFQD